MENLMEKIKDLKIPEEYQVGAGDLDQIYHSCNGDAFKMMVYGFKAGWIAYSNYISSVENEEDFYKKGAAELIEKIENPGYLETIYHFVRRLWLADAEAENSMDTKKVV